MSASVLERPEETSSPLLLFGVSALLGLVVVFDALSPLGLAGWVFYMLPLGVCLFSRSELLPLQVAVVATASIALFVIKPFSDDPLVSDTWVAFANRAMYVSMLWPVALMVRKLVVRRNDSERERWVRETRGNLLLSLQGDLSVAATAERALLGLSNSLLAPVGALYARQGSRLERVATQSLDKRGTPEHFEFGEGLVGGVALSGKLLTFQDVPPGFLHLQAGIGGGEPRHVAVAPLTAEGSTVAVLAVGSLGPIEELDRALLAEIAEPLGMALVSAQRKARLRELLEESQAQAEELQAQQAELEAQQAELEATNEELNQTNSLMEVQTEELERQRDALNVQRREAEQASRYKSEFLANMSHELRTPLNSSLILARLLSENKEGNLTADQVRSAETIYSAGNDLLSLINDILDLAKIEAGRAELAPEPIVLAHLLDRLEQHFEPVARQKGLAFVRRVEAGTPERLVTDARRLEQILRNLLSNAFKFTDRGEVELTVSPEAPGQLRFSVRDTGIGIAPDQREVIFEAFRQADGTTSRKYGGTGLGLSISRELARLLKGKIELESGVGRGSVFTLVVPLVMATEAPRSTPRARRLSLPEEPRPVAPPVASFDDDRSRLARRGRLILVIEDDLTFAGVLYGLAHELDFDCVVASNAEEGRRLARELAPSGILLDVGLPDASGLSVLESLKRDATTRHVPIHVVSATDHVQTALELGAIGYALKPVAREELVQAIQKLEEQHSREVRRVLIVEDDPRQQDSLRGLLGGRDVQLIGAGSVKEALGQLELQSFDCMVLDLTLPDGSGYDLLEKLAMGNRYAFPPVIVYTGRELTREEEERLRRYSSSIIVKGARSPERLLDEVTLFLHKVESTLEPEQRMMLKTVREREAVFEGRTILVVEDDVRNVFALSRVLEPRGAKVEIARNGREALEALAQGPDIDLVLMDLMMPEMDGLTALREIRKQPVFRRLPVIALTAKAMPDDREEALAAGANDYMAKPFDVDKLVSLCRVWLRRS
jgi:signal transduction histidine kinase/DNA-binding response OmpR family regulator